MTAVAAADAARGCSGNSSGGVNRGSGGNEGSGGNRGRGGNSSG